MDAYNRSTAPLGFATPFGAKVIDQTTEGAFAAVAYYLPDADEIIFAYRGTDEPWSDGFTGWPLGSGWYDSPQSQADLAFGFFNDVMADISEPTHEFHYASSADVVFTGHSLGGGLAGLVASINELPAFVFDSMPFTQAANKLYGDVTGPYNYLYWKALAYPDGIVHEPSFDLIQSAALENEALAPLRWGTPFGPLGGAVLTSDIESQRIGQDEIKAGVITDIYDLHSQALLTIALHGGLQHSAQREAGGEAIYHHLFDGALASRLGFADSEALRQMLAYTIDDADTAELDGLFADMDQLGAMRLNEISQFIPANRYFGALGKVAVVHAVHAANDSGAGLSVGLVQHVNGTANIDLSGTLDAIGTINDFIEFAAVGPAGVFFDLNVSQVANLAVAWSGYGGTAYLQAGGTIFFGSEYVDDIYGSDEHDIILSMGSDGAFFDKIWGGGGNDVIYASAGADTIHDGSGNDRAHGGSGNDIFHGGTGSDAMFGETGNDTFHLGEAKAGDVDYVNGGAHTGTGDVVEVSVGATYRLDAAGAAAIRNQIVANGFAAPTGHGIGIEMAAGDAFVQGVEIIRASADANELVVGTGADYVSAGGAVYDFTAGGQDLGRFTGEQFAYLKLKGDQGNSVAARSSSFGRDFIGIDEWSLGDTSDTVIIEKSHAGLQTVIIDAGGASDTLYLKSFTTDIHYGHGILIEAASIIVTGFDRLFTGSGNDSMNGNDLGEYWDAGAGTNTLVGALGADTVVTIGNLIVDYSASADGVHLIREFGTSNTAAVRGSSAFGTLSMGYGDYLSVNGWSEIAGTTGVDVLSVAGSHGTLTSNGGNDELIGWRNGDTLIGADGYYEIMKPGDGNDVVQFGTGGGELNYASSTRAAVIDMIDGTFVFGNQTDIVTGEFNKLVGTQFGDTLKGTDLADIIDGGAANGYDVIYGRGGDDTITFRMGVVHGGSGNDVITSTVDSTIVFGEDDDDTISAGKNSLAYGGDGNDIISARDGSTIYGDAGFDTITVSGQNITVHGGAGGDMISIAGYYGYPRSTLSYSQSDAGVSLVQTGSVIAAAGGHAEGDQISGIFNLVGSDFADMFDLGSATGTIKAGGGNDVITIRQSAVEAHGQAGDDVITLTSRDQRAYGGDGNDTFHGHGAMYGGEGDDEFYLGYGGYYAYAGSYVTTKVGGTVYGGTGQNYIEGGEGNDTVWMDEGSDTFIYSTGGGHDKIYMAGSDDHLVLDGIAGFSSISDIAANLFEDASRTELRFDGFDQKIGFMNMTASQVLALDWAFA